MIKYFRLATILTFMPLVAMGQLKIDQVKIEDAGFGFLMSSKGQSIFYYRGTSPFKINQAFIRSGLHFEQLGISVPYYNQYTGRQEQNSNQQYYIVNTVGARHLFFTDKLAGGLFPYAATEVGAAAYIAQVGSYRNAFRQFALQWAPFVQIGIGAGLHVGDALYRVEGGYLTSIDSLAVSGYPGYRGPFLKLILTNGLKPN